MNVLQAMSDPRLFGAQFPDVASWRPWQAFLAALFGLEMDAWQLDIYERCTGRSRPPEQAFTEALALCGRRSGKTRVAALIACYVAALVDLRRYLAPGEVARILVICPDRRQARVAFAYCRAMLSGAHVLADLIERETSDTLQLSNGVAIEICTCSSVAARGYSSPLVIADESAFWTSETSAQSDTEILNSLRPAMAQFPQRLLLLISSPWAKRGEVYRLHRENFGHDGAPVLVWQADSLTMNPTLPRSVVEQAHERDAVTASVEYGAQFMPDVTSAIDAEALEAAVDTGVRERASLTEPGRARPFRYVGFVDPSGGSGGDSYTAAIAHCDGALVLLDAALEVRPPFNVDEATALIAALCQRYGVAQVEGDHYAGEWPKQALAKLGVTYQRAELPKSAIYAEAVPLFGSGRVRLLDNDRLLHQLRALDRRPGSQGRAIIDHPRGGHDDVANAAAGALWMAARELVRASGTALSVRSTALDDFVDGGDVVYLHADGVIRGSGF